MAALFNKIFNQTNLIQKTLDASWQRNEVIAQNIANVDTPRYKSKSLSFDAEFRAALLQTDTEPAMSRHVSLRPNSAAAPIRDFPDRRRPAPERIDPLSVQPRVLQNDHLTMKMDENNVDIEFEMNEAAKNSLYYYTMLSKINSEMGRIKTAIRDIR